MIIVTPSCFPNAFRPYENVACVAIFFVSFQARSRATREGTGTLEITKKTPPVPLFALAHALARLPLGSRFLRGNGKDCYAG